MYLFLGHPDDVIVSLDNIIKHDPIIPGKLFQPPSPPPTYHPDQPVRVELSPHPVTLEEVKSPLSPPPASPDSRSSPGYIIEDESAQEKQARISGDVTQENMEDIKPVVEDLTTEVVEEKQLTVFTEDQTDAKIELSPATPTQLVVDFKKEIKEESQPSPPQNSSPPQTPQPPPSAPTPQFSFASVYQQIPPLPIKHSVSLDTETPSSSLTLKRKLSVPSYQSSPEPETKKIPPLIVSTSVSGGTTILSPNSAKPSLKTTLYLNTSGKIYAFYFTYSELYIYNHKLLLHLVPEYGLISFNLNITCIDFLYPSTV